MCLPYFYRGVRALAFSPNNSFLASGGSESLIIWSIQQDQCQQIKNFSLKNSEMIQNQIGAGSSGANYGSMMRIAPGSGQEENTAQKAIV